MLDNIHSYNTRKKHQKKPFITRVSSKQAQKCLQCNGPKIWNETPLQIKEMNFCKFKIEFKTKLISAYHYLSFGGWVEGDSCQGQDSERKKCVYCSK